MPIALALTLIFSYTLSQEQWYYDFLFKAQVAFYLLALVGYALRNKNTSIKIVYIPYYFTVMHICHIKGWIRYFLGSQKVTWEKAQRA